MKCTDPCLKPGADRGQPVTYSLYQVHVTGMVFNSHGASKGGEIPFWVPSTNCKLRLEVVIPKATI